MEMVSWSTKPDDTSMDDMNLSAVHVICNQCSILPYKENHIQLWVSYNHSVVHITKLITNVNIVLSKNSSCVLTTCFNLHLVVPQSSSIHTKSWTYCEN